MNQTATRPLTFSSGDLLLEGELHLPARTPAPGVAVCHPHPQYGGDMHNNVVLAACEELMAHGYAALRFNFRGVGHSQGAFDEGRGEQEDARAALACLGGQPEVDAGRLGLIGYSFGAMVAAEVAGAELSALALISPPVAFSDLRVQWGCPTLILGSDSDPVAPADRLQIAATGADAEVQIVAGPDHSWWGFEDDLRRTLVEFFARRFA